MKEINDLVFISTHTPLARRDNAEAVCTVGSNAFLLTRLSRGVTLLQVRRASLILFLLTRLSRGVTIMTAAPLTKVIFLLTRLSRGVTGRYTVMQRQHVISTHTPLARRDVSV